MSLKKVLLTKKIEGVMYDIMPKTAADIVTYTKGSGQDAVETNVAAELAGIAVTLGTLASTADLSALRTEIIGELSNDESLAASFDTIKEIANFLDTHDESIGALAALLTDVGVASVEADPENEIEAVTATGIHAAVELLQSKVAALEAANGTNVSKSKSGASDAGNGELYLDGTLTTVYDDSALVAAIGESESAEGEADGTGILGNLDVLQDEIDTLDATVGKATVGQTPGTGLTARIENLEAGTLTNLVAKSGVDGTVTYTKNGQTTDVVAYGGDPTVVQQDSTHRFVTDAQKADWDATVTYVTAANAPTAANAKDNTLYLVDLTPAAEPSEP